MKECLPAGSAVGSELQGSISILPSVAVGELLSFLVSLTALTAQDERVKIHSNRRKEKAQEGKKLHFIGL